MKSYRFGKIEAGVIVTLFIVGGFFLPMSSALQFIERDNNSLVNNNKIILDEYIDLHPVQTSENDPYIIPDGYFDSIVKTTLDDYENDMGYNVDAGDRINAAAEMYVGERVDDAPGRTREGTLDPDGRDTEDWYRFYAVEGQTIQASIDSSEDFDIVIADTTGTPVGTSYGVDETGIYFIKVFSNEGAGAGSYTIDVSLNGQNDAGTGSDAGDDMGSATSISEGDYIGYMSINDVEDWYSFSVNSGQGIYFNMVPMEKSDYDLHLYDPDGILVLSEQYHGEDTIEYPADKSGTWKVKIDMFPGWDESEWPENYFLYGSGPYDFTLELGGSYERPADPLAQPEITPIAQTFIINDDPSST